MAQETTRFTSAIQGVTVVDPNVSYPIEPRQGARYYATVLLRFNPFEEYVFLHRSAYFDFSSVVGVVPNGVYSILAVWWNGSTWSCDGFARSFTLSLP